MALEIERKFLVNSNDYKKLALEKKHIVQGFLSRSDATTVRVRLCNNRAFLTIKSRVSNSFLTRYEFEKSIDFKDGQELLALCRSAVIEKNRYLVKIKNHIFEVDEFLKDNKGLVVAEVELNSENEIFDKPQWLGLEVTGLAIYYNAHLAQNPYKNWKNK